ncbi:metalloendopeptidase [Recurvomyces mirabilis]|uniref:Metalloendopeptidase n=1 Tax=Recurvomyces mirabilis TaxID=574656 RepID=A0AAE0TQY7_9PEZI|nr:metalloendopeptidase [Recurvomyces mirabilis]KAK5152490.1 hypothetical protein LTS14_008437 [Recurvomyces mirabilis]
MILAETLDGNVNPITGDITITAGLLHLANSDYMIAIILAHEIAHVITGHLLERVWEMALLSRLLLPVAPLILSGAVLAGTGLLAAVIPIGLLGLEIFAAVLLAVPGVALMSPAVVAMLAVLGASRVREQEADFVGLLLATQAGFNPGVAIRLWAEMGLRMEKYLKELQVKVGKNVFGRERVRQVDKWAATHPLPAYRVDQLRKAVPIARDIVRLAGDPRLADYASKNSSDTSHATALRWCAFLDGNHANASTVGAQ